MLLPGSLPDISDVTTVTHTPSTNGNPSIPILRESCCALLSVKPWGRQCIYIVQREIKSSNGWKCKADGFEVEVASRSSEWRSLYFGGLLLCISCPIWTQTELLYSLYTEKPNLGYYSLFLRNCVIVEEKNKQSSRGVNARGGTCFLTRSSNWVSGVGGWLGCFTIQLNDCFCSKW